ncbi:MAG: phenylalanine--tRNA ligase subunit alpha [Actinobacteria bacterium]|nr:phenylalanine--tRNA ligase subunit alpha [Actinomycetota bacterium]MCL5886809.1 phenylalanine--tRNA ligase subunit alpha [Actinomycetota bacterium]
MNLIEELHQIREQAIMAVSTAQDASELEEARLRYLGKKGSLTQILRGLGSLSAEEKPLVGSTANEVRTGIEAALEEKTRAISSEALRLQMLEDSVDVTLPGRRHPLGRQHLIERITREVVEIFVGLGYRIAEGPQVELAYYNFTALNTPQAHPARSPSGTFYVRDQSVEADQASHDSEVLLRTHTSPVQVRVMESSKPPIYILAPGKVYRRDIPDPSHLPQFTQVEGLVVDEGVTFADLKGTLEHFCHEMFGADRKTRFRPHFFPFTEPSAEVDVSCGICAGSGCRFCGNTGWLEILGCGMVDPNVFEYVGIDSERYGGFAFGMGVERIAALKYDLPDLRMLVEGDMRFLAQF